MSEIVPLSDSWITKLYNQFLVPLGFPLLPPVQYKNFARFRALIYTPSLRSLARDLNFNFSHEDRQLLKDYDWEISKINYSIFCTLLLFALLYYFQIILSLDIIRRLLWLPYSYYISIENANLYLLPLLAFSIFWIVFLLIANKISQENIIQSSDSTFINYAEALALREIFYIIKQLKKKNTLKKWKSRKILITRIRFLAKNTRLIGLKYSKKEPERHSKIIIIRNYQNISAQINEKASCWLTQCRATTHNDLEQYFCDLVPIYLRQEYGEIELTNIEVNRRQINRSDLKKEIKADIEWIIKTFSSIINLIPQFLKSLWGKN